MNVLEIAEQYSGPIFSWLFSSGIKIVAILIIAAIAKKIVNVFLTKLIRKSVVGSRFSSAQAEEKREDTLIKISTSTVGILIWILTGLIVLSEIGIDIGPLLAAAGVAGLAFGFGGQYLIRDVITGLFLILENQYRVGDTVCFDTTCGTVEDVTLRMTTLRNLDGTVIHVPHGSIGQVSNLSKEFARINLDVGVSYNADLEKVITVVNRVGSELANDPEWKDKITKTPQFLRVNDLADSSVIVKILGETKPHTNIGVEGELRKRLKIAFDKEGIEIPFPQMVIHKGE